MTNRGRPPLLSDETILEQALAAFAEDGFTAMSVRALNAKLGLSHETISKRFGSKSELFCAAVAHGFALFNADFSSGLTDGSPTNDLERLRVTIRAFMIAISRHPTLGALLHHPSIDEKQRNLLISETGLGEQISATASLLTRLHAAGVIHETRIRELWVLAEGAVTPLHFHELSQMFDVFDGPINRDNHIARMTDIIMRSMLI